MLDDTALLEAFEAGEEPAGGFHHREHVRVAWCYLKRHDLPDALKRFSESLKRFAIARGKPGLYHETITVAFVLLTNERLDGSPPDETWTQFADRNADLLTWRPSVIDRYYLADTIASDRARRTFVFPDRITG